MTVSSKQRIVVVGGGAAGGQFAHAFTKKLDFSKYEFTLVTKHEEYPHRPGVLRMFTTSEGKLEDRTFIPYDKLFSPGKGKLVFGTVTKIESDGAEKGGRVVLQNDERVEYDVLALATGNTWTGTFGDFPATRSEVKAVANGWREKIKNANTIAIAGGGAVGIEMAGEIKQFYPSKTVILVHSQAQLLSSAYPDKFRNDVAVRLKSRNVSLILEDTIVDFSNPKAITSKGASLNADLILSASGGRPDNKWIADSLSPEVLSERGYVNVSPTLQVKGYQRIFAMGDLVEWVEQKQVIAAMGHRNVVGANLLDVLNERKPRKEYKGSFNVIFLSIGTTAGAGFFGILWGLMFGNIIVPMLKSKDLVIGMTRGNIGL